MPQTIIPHLWFDTEAKEAAEFYASIFPESRITNTTILHDTPAGNCEVVSFELAGQEFMAISAGPHFKFTPAISFMVNFDPSRDPSALANLDAAWAQLSAGGSVMMPLDAYPWSDRYGWVQDRYGLSWQLMLTRPEREPRPFIMPSLLFVQDVYGRAEEAIDHYVNTFGDSMVGLVDRFGPDQAPEREGNVMFADFRIDGTWFAVMESAQIHEFGFNEAVSFMICCPTQESINHYWTSLSAVPEAEMCGWLKDQFGVSWQVVPAAMNTMLRDGSAAQVASVTAAFLEMKKFDLKKLNAAYASA